MGPAPRSVAPTLGWTDCWGDGAETCRAGALERETVRRGDARRVVWRGFGASTVSCGRFACAKTVWTPPASNVSHPANPKHTDRSNQFLRALLMTIPNLHSAPLADR